MVTLWGVWLHDVENTNQINSQIMSPLDKNSETFFKELKPLKIKL